MDEDKLLEFLKSYADSCKDKKYFRDYAPFSTRLSMPGGYVGIEDKNGNQVCSFMANHDPFTGEEFPYSPSMPVSPVSIAFANFTVAALNAYADTLNEEKGEDNG